MTILITAGAVSERIDSVRRITNTATGRLGALTAEALHALAGNRIEEIIYVCETTSAIPDIPRLRLIHTSGTEELENVLISILSTERPAAVIHSMAVSDYSVESVWADDGSGEKQLDKTVKISSDIEQLVLRLSKTPKIISLIKETVPETVLIGFKLLDSVTTEELVGAAHALLLKNRCNLVLANDSLSFRENGHTGYLVSPDGSYVQIDGKQKIAETLARAVLDLTEHKEEEK